MSPEVLMAAGYALALIAGAFLLEIARSEIGYTDQRPSEYVSVMLAAALLALGGHAVVLSVWPAAHTLMIDLQVYRAGAEHLLVGRSLYAGGVLLDLPFVYPPFAAVVFVPMLVLPLAALKIVWTAAGLALLGVVGYRSLRRMGVPLYVILVGDTPPGGEPTALDPERSPALIFDMVRAANGMQAAPWAQSLSGFFGDDGLLLKKFIYRVAPAEGLKKVEPVVRRIVAPPRRTGQPRASRSGVPPCRRRHGQTLAALVLVELDHDGLLGRVAGIGFQRQSSGVAALVRDVLPGLKTMFPPPPT